MLKYLIYISVGYLVYKVAKNGVQLAINSFQTPKELDENTELVKCDNCGNFVGKSIALSEKKEHFCSEDCQQAFLDKKP
ncbi:MAG: hypothetical protein GY866_12925 [Proteobacteria bacterium]|nr:hypothetical protein [Pseudomonadota bacterium]